MVTPERRGGAKANRFVITLLLNTLGNASNNAFRNVLLNALRGCLRAWCRIPRAEIMEGLAFDFLSSYYCFCKNTLIIKLFFMQE